MLSFHPVKAVTTAEGGVVTTRDSELRDRMRRFRNHGITRDRDCFRETGEGGWYHEQQELGFNYRLSDVHSALGRSQLDKLDPFHRGAKCDRRRATASGSPTSLSSSCRPRRLTAQPTPTTSS